MKIINVFIVSIIAIFGCLVTSCSDDETGLSRAVLASTELLVYDVEPSESQMILVTSDGDWVAEFPEWITVAPSSGKVGQTEVTISVTKNVRDNLPDNPRKAEVLFKGRNLESIARVLVRQNGDKLRDPVDYTIEAIASVEDETVVRLPEMTVVALTSNGFIATDGTSFTYVKEPATIVTVGQKVNIVGEKHSDSMHMTYMLGERISDAGTGTLPPVTPFDISSTLDQTEGNVYKYVTVTGDFDGTAITVSGMTNKVYLIDPLAELGLSKLNGHKIKLTGFYAGVAAPVVNVIPTDIEDLGQNQVIIYSEDFEWIAPWAIAGKDGTPAGDTVGANGTEAPKADACTYNGKTAFEELTDRGYEFVSAHDYVDAKGKRDFALYLQQNYLKFNKTGNVDGKPFQEGIILPAMPVVKDVPAGVNLMISFDWCPQMQGDGMYDKTEMAVIVINGEEQIEIVAPGHSRADSSPYSWQNAVLDLSNVTINENTRLLIRNSNDAWAQKTAHRFYLDNIKVYYLP